MFRVFHLKMMNLYIYYLKGGSLDGMTFSYMFQLFVRYKTCREWVLYIVNLRSSRQHDFLRLRRKNVRMIES